MINWKELEKFITPGKVCTLVIMVDGKEIGAFSFNIETLAYKEILESKPMEPVKVADKSEVSSEIKKAETERKDSLKAKKGTKPVEKIEPEPLDKDNEEENDNKNVDEETGEIIEENKAETVKEVVNNTPAASTVGNAGVPEKRLTRAEIMAQSEAEAQKHEETSTTMNDNDHVHQRGSVSSGPVKEPEKKIEPEKKVVEQTFGEEW